MKYKNWMLTDDDIAEIVAIMDDAISDYGYRCSDGHWLTEEELAEWDDEMFIEAYDAAFGIESLF